MQYQSKFQLDIFEELTKFVFQIYERIKIYE